MKEVFKRRRRVFPKAHYNLILREYQRLKGIKLGGYEAKPILQAVKSMFLDNRTVEQIIHCMRWFAKSKQEWTKYWTIHTIQKKLPEFLAGKLEERKDEFKDL